MPRSRAIPNWLAIAWTILVIIIIPVYWRYYGPRNFLWFSDIALIGLVFVLWFESRLIVSMIALGVLPLEMLWNLEFFTRLLFGVPLLGMSAYMWDQTIPIGVRLLSLFHIPLVIVILFALQRLRYDRRALLVQTGLAWIVLPLSALLSDDANNINWARGLGPTPYFGMHPILYLALLMVGVPIVAYLPTHAVLKRAFPPASAQGLGCQQRPNFQEKLTISGESRN